MFSRFGSASARAMAVTFVDAANLMVKGDGPSQFGARRQED
jgi:hypothetical protein